MKYLQIFKKYQTTCKRNYCYLGIKRVDFPKWIGWKLIEKYKQQGIHVSKINDPILDLMVENFYITIFLKEAQNAKNKRGSD